MRGDVFRYAMRRELGVEDMVVLAGWVPNAATVALPAFDVFFQPSLWEAMSVAILEAKKVLFVVACRIFLTDKDPVLLYVRQHYDEAATGMGPFVKCTLYRRRAGSARAIESRLVAASVIGIRCEVG